ncbi:hypothetical protein EDC01DRAFT_362860 [Geopyxis carbonaria]|nr:hypothetical protein EDC01DRAFT_362860 [Geopyxis carbonaria]
MSRHGSLHQVLKGILGGNDDNEEDRGRGSERPGGKHFPKKDRVTNKEQLEREKKERERLDHERAEKERLERDKNERARVEREKAERERREQDQRERERKDQKKKEQEELERKRRQLEEEWNAKSPLAKRLYSLFDIPCDLSTLPAAEFPEGSRYRVHNKASLSCLSSTTIETKPVGPLPVIAPMPTATPGRFEELQQIWTVVRPETELPSTQVQKDDRKFTQNHTASNTYILESNAYKAQGGTAHAFRIDLQEVTAPRVEGPVPNAAENPINGLPPRFPIGLQQLLPVTSAADSSTPPGNISSSTDPAIVVSPPKPAVKPILEPETTRIVVASPLGSRTSEWIFVPTWEHGQYFIANAVSGDFLVHSGDVVVAASLKARRKSLHDWRKATRAKDPPIQEKRPDFDDEFISEWQKWMWKVEPWDNGPASGFYRIVHSLAPLAVYPITEKLSKLNSISQSSQSMDHPVKGSVLLGASIVIPSAATQIWNLSAVTTQLKVFNNVYNYSPEKSLQIGSISLSTDQLRIIAVPRTPTQPDSLYKIYNPSTRSVLGLTFSKNAETRNLGWIRVAYSATDDDETVLGQVYSMTDPAESESGYAMWRFHAEQWAPNDGLYTISQPSETFLSIPPEPVGDPLPIRLEPRKSYTATPETQWWWIMSYITNVGIIYQEITNYRSGHSVNVTVAGGADGKVNGQRLGIVTENDWTFSSGNPTNRIMFTIQSVRVKQHFLWGISEAELITSTAPYPFQWKLEKVDTVFPGNVLTKNTPYPEKQFYLVNLATNLLLSTNGDMSLNKPLILASEAGPRQQWHPQQDYETPSYILYSNTRPPGASDGRLFAATPPVESDWVPENGVGLEFPVEAAEKDRDPYITKWKPVKRTTDIEGYALITTQGKAMGVREVGDHEWSVILGTEKDTTTDPFMFFSWKFIEVGADIPSPAAVKHLPTKAPFVPDGMYRIVSRQRHLALSLNEQDVIKRRDSGVEHPMSLGLTVSTSENNNYDIWYIQRERREKLLQPLTSSENVIYTIRSSATALFLDTGDAAARQRYEGVPSWATPDQKIYRTQQWRILKQSALGWAIESRSIGSILDSTGQLLTTNPLLGAVPNKSHIWQLDPVTCSLSSGAFFYPKSLHWMSCRNQTQHLDSQWSIRYCHRRASFLQAHANSVAFHQSVGRPVSH